jgi:ATP-dependent Lon protease
MEVIRLSGYTEDEKTNIALRYLLPKQMKNNGVKADELEVSEAAVRDIIRYYSREAGVRALERELSKICRKVVKNALLKEGERKTKVTPRNLDKYLGVRRFTFGMAEKDAQIGQVTGLAWTEVGGELLTIESAIMPGKGNIIRTGSLGDVMKESVEAARTVVRSRARRLGIKDEAFEKSDIHIHFPEGATPKDGPSAGIAITTGLVSSLTGIPVRPDVAMTGEITLRGEVLAIGGLKEKLLAAKISNITTVLIPKANVPDLKKVPNDITKGMKIIPVEHVDQVLRLALDLKKPEEFLANPLVGALPTPVMMDKKPETGTTGKGGAVRH